MSQIIISGATLALSVGVVLVITKPGRESFKDMVKELFGRARNEVVGTSGFLNLVLGASVSKLVNASVQREVHDCFLFNIGTWRTNNQYATYLGALNTWWLVDSSERLVNR
jgi:hypothetical protein